MCVLSLGHPCDGFRWAAWVRTAVYARGHFQRSRHQNLVVCVYGAGGVQLRLNAVLVSSGLQVGRETPRGDKTASTESEHKMRSLCWRPELDLFVRRRENALLRCVLDGRGEVALRDAYGCPRDAGPRTWFLLLCRRFLRQAFTLWASVSVLRTWKF